MKITTCFPSNKKTGLVFLVVIVALLQSTISVPALKTLGVGMEAPEFVLQDINGDQQDFSSLKGDKLTLIIFWASWSRQSEKALKQIERLYADYKNKGFSVVGVNVERQNIDDEALSAVQGVVERLALSFPNLVDHGLTTFHDYGIIAVPSIVILDKDRKIRFEMSGFPMVGTRDMMMFLAAEVEGKKAPAEVTEKTGYQPDIKAVRSWNMGTKAMKSKRMAHTAEKWFKKAILDDPDFIPPYISLGAFYQNRGDLVQAKEQFQNVLARKPENVSALGGLALLLIEEGEFTEAGKMLEKAVVADEAYVPGYIYLAYLAGKGGDLTKASDLFAIAEEINPMDHHIHLYRGKMFEELDNVEKAMASYKVALRQLLNL